VTSDSLLSGHAKSEEQHRREICIAGRWMYERGHIVACEEIFPCGWMTAAFSPRPPA